jgi:hypothetical protein
MWAGEAQNLTLPHNLQNASYEVGFQRPAIHTDGDIENE